MDYLANEKWATRHETPGTGAALAASTVRNIGGNRAGTGIAKKVDIEAFVSGVVDQQLAVAVAMAVENIQDGAEVSEFQGCADVFAHPHCTSLACIHLFNRQRRVTPQPQAHEEGSVLIDRPAGSNKQPRYAVWRELKRLYIVFKLTLAVR